MLKSSIERDDDVEFRNLIYKFMDSFERDVADGEYYDITQEVIRYSAGKCYVAVSNLMRLDEDRSYHAKTIEMLESMCINDRHIKLERYISAIETIFKAYIKNTNYLRCFNVIHGAAYMGDALKTSEILELYLNLGLDTKKKIQFVAGELGMDLQEYLEHVCRVEKNAGHKKSLDMLINFKIKKEKETLNRSLPLAIEENTTNLSSSLLKEKSDKIKI